MYRLKITLDLPPIEPRPPIPPRVYKRLYTHLDNILPGKQVRGTPSSSRVRQNALSSPALGSAIKSVENKGLDRSVSRSARKAAAADITLVDTPTKSTSRGFVKSIQSDSGLHPWVRGVLAVLVAEFRREEYGRIILAGVQHVIAPSGRRTRDKWVSGHLPATVAGIFVVSMDRLDAILLGDASENDTVIPIMEKTLDIMHHSRENLDVKGLGSSEFWDGWINPTMADVEEAIKRATTEWIDADWYVALEDVSSENARAHRGKGKAKGRNRREVNGNGGIHKADTMHQPRYDFLGEKQQKDHEMWLKSVASRLAEHTDGDVGTLEKVLGVRPGS